MQHVRIESLHEFMRRMNCPYIQDQRQLKRTINPEAVPIFFENGGVSVDGRHWEPPLEDPVQLARNQISYCKLKLEVEEAEFGSFRQYLVDQADFNRRGPSSCPPPTMEQVQQLEAGRQRIEALRSRVAVLRQQVLEATDPELIRARRDRGEQEARGRQQSAQVLHAIRNISV